MLIQPDLAELEDNHTNSKFVGAENAEAGFDQPVV